MLKSIVQFKKNPKDKDFGNWDSISYQVDPFFDNDGSLRVSNYIEILYQYFNKGYTSNQCIVYANKFFIDKFGTDKVINYKRNYGKKKNNSSTNIY